MITKPLVNLIGALLVLAALIGGILLVAAPMYFGAKATSAEAQGVETDNLVFDARLTALQADEKRFDEIADEVAALRAQIPIDTRADDVFEIVATAATESGATVVSVTSTDIESWAPRIASNADAPTESAAAEAEAPASGPAVPADPTPTETTPEGGTATEPAETANDRTQVSFTIVVETADPAQAVAFVDALGRGPRLLAVVQATLAPATDAYNVTVTALTFMRADS